MIPSKKWAYDLIRLKQMPQHILNHSMAVERIAVEIASRLPDKIDIRLVETGALLHDICKIDSIRTGEDHAKMGGRLLEILDCPEVASIVRQHVHLESDELNEAMIVHYADKRVMHEEVVSLSRRFVDLMERYGKDKMRKERISNLYLRSIEIEKIIFKATGIDAEGSDDLCPRGDNSSLGTI
ncbi:MAG TPA: HD domain-containing protein [Desulfomonilia bacterium]